MKVMYKNKQVANTTQDYTELVNKPYINSVEVVGNITYNDLDLYNKEEVENLIASSRSVKQVAALPSPTVKNTMYYVGPTSEGLYHVYLFDSDNNMIDLGTSSDFVKKTGDELTGTLEVKNNAKIELTTGNNYIQADVPGSPIIASKTTVGKINLYGGTGWSDGAALLLYGKDYTTDSAPGSFGLSAYDGTNRYSLSGKTDGTLTWGSNDISGNWSKVTVELQNASAGNLFVYRIGKMRILNIAGVSPTSASGSVTIGTLSSTDIPEVFTYGTLVENTHTPATCAVSSIGTDGNITVLDESGGTYYGQIVYFVA